MRYAFLPRLLFSLLVALGLAVLTTGVVGAHPKIVSIEPPPDSPLEAPPARVRIVFDEPIEPLSSLQLFDAQGRQVDQGGGAPLPNDLTTLELLLPPLVPGIYTVVWTIIGSDSHILKDNFAFTVLGEAMATPRPAVGSSPPTPPSLAQLPAAASTPVSPEPAINPAAVALRGAMLIGATDAVGGLAFLFCVLIPALAMFGLVPTPAVHTRWRLLVVGLLGLLLLAAPAMLLVHTQEATSRLDARTVQQVLVGTRFGQALLARCGLALGLLVAVLTWSGRSWQRPWISLTVGTLAAVLLFTFSASGHASAEPSPLLPVLADWLHLLATSLWVGGLICFTLLAPLAVRLAPDVQRAPLLSGIFARFSGLALGSVAVLTLTGAYAALRELSALADLWQTAYGQALLIKLLLFTGLISLGAYHLLIARPRLDAWASHTVERVLAVSQTSVS